MDVGMDRVLDVAVMQPNEQISAFTQGMHSLHVFMPCVKASCS